MDILPPARDGVFTKRLANGTEKSWPTPKPELTAGIVCEKACNNGWMSTKLEIPMKAVTEDILLQNNPKTFSSSDLASIAAWAFKTTILANHMEMRGKPFFSEEQRRAFASDLSIPEGVYVWIAQRNAGYLTARYMSALRIMQPPTPIAPHLKGPPLSPYRFEIYDCIFSVGYLLLQVIAARWTERKIANSLDFPLITQSEFFNDYGIPIWPNNAGLSVDWPPPLSVSNKIFELFCNRFKKFNLPPWMS